MSLNFVLRIVGGIAMAVVGWHLDEAVQGRSPRLDASLLVSLSLSGFILGLLLTPDLTIRPFIRLKTYLQDLSDDELLAGAIGLLAALVMSALSALPLSFLPGVVGKLAPVSLGIVLAYFGTTLGVERRRRVLAAIPPLGGHEEIEVSPDMAQPGNERGQPLALLDTSVIVDGRIVQVSRTGFVPGSLVIPRFVLDELQQLADSADQRRRTSGRHGLEMLRLLKEQSVVPVEIVDVDADSADDVDRNLVGLAKRMHCPIITTDWNLNRVAEIQNVPVLNVNALADAVRPMVTSGARLRIRLVEAGGQPGQARGYLEDGTMVVVENGFALIGHDADVVVQRIRQQDSGRIIFATPGVSDNGAI